MSDGVAHRRLARKVVDNGDEITRRMGRAGDGMRPLSAKQRRWDVVDVIMGIEYIAAINEDDYKTFKMIVTTHLPDDYGMWLRVRERGKLRAFKERRVTFDEVEISPIEFGTYCKALKKPDFSVASLDRCARAKVLAPASAVFGAPALRAMTISQRASLAR
jgi:hypothetical protein